MMADLDSRNIQCLVALDGQFDHLPSLRTQKISLRHRKTLQVYKESHPDDSNFLELDPAQ